MATNSIKSIKDLNKELNNKNKQTAQHTNEK